ncbi:MAG: MBL fold metallo-hydrolase [Alphaproteobacteria bacterium]
MKRWQKVLVAVVLVIAVLGGAVVWLGWSLGAHLEGERLRRVQASSNYGEGVFVNVEPEASFEITWDAVYGTFYGPEQREPPAPPPVVPLDPGRLQGMPPAGLRTTWLGHASVLVEIDGHRVMIDPVLSERASPFSSLGPRRFHPPPIALEDVTGIDAVVISHNHYDHMDKATLVHLASQGTHIFVPLGTGTFLARWDIPAAQIHELDWWQEETLGALTIVATPARHYSGRGMFDYQATLWASWSILGPDHRVFYSGDSGYSKLFKEIGDRYGPFDVNVIKVGSYGPGQGWIDIHMPPEQSVQVHIDVAGKRMLPVHWATFNLARHDWDEPIRRAIAAAAPKGVALLTPRIGETVDAARPIDNHPWWEAVR